MPTSHCLASSLALLCLVAATAHAQPAPGAFAERDPRYRLQISDVIEVQYRYTPEYNQAASLQPDGFVSLQLVGDVKLAGLTLDQAKTAITTQAAARLRDPDVSILLKEYEKPHFFVGGEVKAPGRFELRGHLTAIEAITMAGGFNSPSAKHSQVILFRRIDGERAETRILNVKEAIRARTLKEDVSLRPGDILLVPQNRVSKIERFIKWSNVGVYWNPSQRY